MPSRHRKSTRRYTRWDTHWHVWEQLRADGEIAHVHLYLQADMWIVFYWPHVHSAVKKIVALLWFNVTLGHWAWCLNHCHCSNRKSCTAGMQRNYIGLSWFFIVFYAACRLQNNIRLQRLVSPRSDLSIFRWRARRCIFPCRYHYENRTY